VGPIEDQGSRLSRKADSTGGDEAVDDERRTQTKEFEMSVRTDNNSIKCRTVRLQFVALADSAGTRLSAAERSALNRHLDGCSRCSHKYRLYTLGRTVLHAAGASEPIHPDKEFFVALRARIARGPLEPAPAADRANGDESWAAALLLTTRQLIPAMAMLLALIIGATFVWNDGAPKQADSGLRPSELLVLGDQFGYPGATTDDVLETLVAVEERENGR
jgi:anti-sigma factor RsiW